MLVDDFCVFGSIVWKPPNSSCDRRTYFGGFSVCLLLVSSFGFYVGSFHFCLGRPCFIYRYVEYAWYLQLTCSFSGYTSCFVCFDEVNSNNAMPTLFGCLQRSSFDLWYGVFDRVNGIILEDFIVCFCIHP